LSGTKGVQIDVSEKVAENKQAIRLRGTVKKEGQVLQREPEDGVNRGVGGRNREAHSSEKGS